MYFVVRFLNCIVLCYLEIMETERATININRSFSVQSKHIIFNVFNYIKRLFPGENKTALKARVHEATGVSIRTIERVIKEGNEGNKENTETNFLPPKKHKRKTTITDLPEYEKSDIRNFIYNFHKTEGCRVSVKNLHRKLLEEYEWTGSTTSVYRIIKDLGFKWKKTRDNRLLLIERNDIRALRIKYLEKIKYFRNQGYPIVFLDETYIHAGHTASKSWTDNTSKGLFKNISKGARLIIIHAGGDMGFIPNALLIFKSGTKSGDYHDEMNSENYEKWLREKLIPNLPPGSVVVTDNAPYHNKQIDKAPTSNSTKSEMTAWLTAKNIDFSANMYKPQLYEIIKKNKASNVIYKFDCLLREHGHVALRLPPYHPDLNPIENIWAQVKNNIARKNVDFKLETVRELAESEFKTVTVDDWIKRCRNVIKNEDKYLENERQIDVVTEELVINLNSSSGEDDSLESDENDD